MSPCPVPMLLPLLAGATSEWTPPPPPMGGEKAVRDALGAFPHEASSTNFVVKWGDTGDFDDADALLAAFEVAWEAEITRMAFPPPVGADFFKFNVYVGDTGDPAPSAEGYAGFFTLDPEGVPMIVMAADAVDDGSAALTAAHEFFHAVQHGTGSYQDDPAAAWYWEATAMWVEGEVYPGDPDEAAFLFALGLAPQLPLWDAVASDGLRGYHPYGAFLYPRYLTDEVADWTWIRDSWTDPRAAPTPQTTLAARLVDEGEDPAEVYRDYAARTAFWDFDQHDVYVAVMDQWRARWSADPDSAELAATLDEVGSVHREGAAGGGFQVIDHGALAPGAWTLRIDADAGVPWQVTVVEDAPGGPTYHPLALTDGVGTLALDTQGVAVRTVISTWVEGETTGAWTLTLEGGPPELPGDDTAAADTGPGTPAPTDGTCGCGVGGAGAVTGLALWLVGALGLRRRPRPAVRGPAG